MDRKHYTTDELKRMKILYDNGLYYFEIAKNLGRTVYSVQLRINRCVHEDPEHWKPIRSRVRVGKMFPGLEEVWSSVGYELGSVHMVGKKLAITIDEPQSDLKPEDVERDFEDALKKYGVFLCYSCKDNVLIVSLGPNKSRILRRAKRFLPSCAETIKRYKASEMLLL